MAKKLKITVENRVYDVTVEEVEEVGARPQAPASLPTQVPRPFISVVSPAPAASAAPAAAAIAPPPPPRPATPPPQAAAAGPGSVLSPLSGVIVSVDVAVGQAVAEGQKLVCLEAMKMNSDVLAPHAGKVSGIHVDVGASVTEGQVLVTLG